MANISDGRALILRDGILENQYSYAANDAKFKMLAELETVGRRQGSDNISGLLDGVPKSPWNPLMYRKRTCKWNIQMLVEGLEDRKKVQAAGDAPWIELKRRKEWL